MVAKAEKWTEFHIRLDERSIETIEVARERYGATVNGLIRVGLEAVRRRMDEFNNPDAEG